MKCGLCLWFRSFITQEPANIWNDQITVNSVQVEERGIFIPLYKF